MSGCDDGGSEDPAQLDVAVLGLLSLQRGNRTIFNSGDLLLRLIGFAVVLSPGGLLWSVDAAPTGAAVPSATAPRPVGHALPAAAAGGRLLLSAWAKARGGVAGRTAPPSPGCSASRTSSASGHPAGCWTRPLVQRLLTWATLAFEATFIVLVWPRASACGSSASACVLHLGIDVFFDIGFFSHAICLTYLAFFPPGHRANG